ncbi:MAG: ATP-binding protein, partial [Bacteroidota bacterium]
MPNPKSRAYLNWSSGKDASLALYTLRQAGEVVVEKLLTAVNKEYDRVTMHGLPRRVLEAQAQAIGLPLETVALGATPSMEDYDRIMREKGQQLRAEGLEYSVFGDIFLEDLRQYREAQLRPLGLKPCFPLWKKDTRQLLLDFIALGFRAVVVCCNAQQLPRTFCGRPVDEQFLADLPAGV